MGCIILGLRRNLFSFVYLLVDIIRMKGLRWAYVLRDGKSIRNDEQRSEVRDIHKENKEQTLHVSHHYT